MAASSTRSLAVGQRLHHLKVFFSNRFVYAQVTRKTDGHVRAVRPPPRAFFRLILGARARTHDAILTPSSLRSPREQILASASTIEREMRESLPNRSDKNAAAAVGRAIAEARTKLGLSDEGILQVALRCHGLLSLPCAHINFLSLLACAGVVTHARVPMDAYLCMCTMCTYACVLAPSTAGLR